jgi:hydrogenase maturation factor
MRVVRGATVDTDLATCTDEHSELHAIAVDLVAPVAAGDRILVHAGVAIRHLGAAA